MPDPASPDRRTRRAGPAGPLRTVLACTTDPQLRDRLEQLAAAAGAPLRVEPDCPSHLGDVALVLLGADVAAPGAPRRPGVLVVTLDGDRRAWHLAVAAGAEGVLQLPADEPALVERMADALAPGGPAPVVGVLGGCGGAGASVLATALAAVAAERGRSVLLADLDPLGGGLDLLVGADDLVGLRWPDLAGSRGRLPATSLHDLLPRVGPLAVLSWGRVPADVPLAAVEAVLRAARRGHELVVVDLPRSGEASAVGLRCVDEVLLVVPARLRAVLAAQQLLARLGAGVPVRAVVRRGADARLAPGSVADALGLALAATVHDDPRLDLEGGEPPGLRRRTSLRETADRCLAGIDRGPAREPVVAA